MAVREILLLGNPVLRNPCEKVKIFSDAVLHTVVEDLSDTLTNFRLCHGFGRGIAAPQIGITRRIIFIHVDAPIAIVNPVITKRSKHMMTLWDDCFSFPDILVKLKRNVRIEIQYQDESGKKQHLGAEGGLSELLQHEIDHLDGVLAIDRAIDSKHIMLRSEWNKMADAQRAVHPL